LRFTRGAANSPNLQLGSANYPVSTPRLTMDLTTDTLPLPRLRAQLCGTRVVKETMMPRATKSKRRKERGDEAAVRERILEAAFARS